MRINTTMKEAKPISEQMFSNKLHERTFGCIRTVLSGLNNEQAEYFLGKLYNNGREGMCPVCGGFVEQEEALQDYFIGYHDQTSHRVLVCSRCGWVR